MSSTDSDSDFDDILVVRMLCKRKKKRRHNYWVHDLWQERPIYGEYHHLIRQLFGYEDKFFVYFRMYPHEFNNLLAMLREELTKDVTTMRRPIGPEERLAICLRFLATGDSYNTISTSFRVGKTTVSRIVKETCEAIWMKLQPLYMPKPDRNHWERGIEGFYTKWQFPNCLGALDGKHVLIFAPKKSGSMYFNYKKTFSVVLLALVDHDYSFSVIDVGSYGSNSDGGIFRRSVLGQGVASGTLHIPEEKHLPDADHRGLVPCVIVADEAFPSLQNLLRPFPGRNLPVDQRIFNYRLSRARRISENAFGILVNRWRLFHRKIPLQPENVDAVVMATCVLHNMLQKRGTAVPPPPQPKAQTDRIDDGILQNLEQVGHRQKKDALVVRETFKDYFMSDAGAVSWQHQSCFGED